MTSGDASHWDDLFEHELIPAVLDHIFLTWQRMQSPGPSDLEEAISIRLYAALVNGKDRSRHSFLIRYEDVEIDIDLIKEIGRKDIVIYPSTFEEIYFCVEAKRLNAIVSGVRKSLADEYVKEGMQRFINGKYSRHVRHGAMVGYVLDSDIQRAMTNVANNIRSNHMALKISPPGDWSDSNARPNDPACKLTEHSREWEAGTFQIHHLFLSAAAS